MRALLSSSLLLVALASGGCFFPYLEQHRPRIDGLVVDAQAQPLGGTTIVARTVYETGRMLCFETRSDATGRFRIPRHREWNVWMPMTRPLGAMTIVSARLDAPRLAAVDVDNRKSRVRVTLKPAGDGQRATLDARPCAPP
jgi:hypothetical protein